MTIKVYGSDLIPINYIYSETNIDIYCDTKEYYENNNIKIFYQVEPNVMSNIYDWLIEESHKYDYIFVYEPYRFKNKNVFRKNYGTTWITKDNYENIDVSIKQFRISFISGWKLNTLAHKHRINLYCNQNYFYDFPITFYRTQKLTLVDNEFNNPIFPFEAEAKIKLFQEFQFSFVLENSREENYFSEKLIDCLITKTIPIYYGCKNIHKYFDITGWIIIDSDEEIAFLEEVFQKLKSLHKSYYQQYKSIIDSNYNRALRYTDFNYMILKDLSIISKIDIQYP